MKEARSGLDRRANCTEHEEQHRKIDGISICVAKQSGQWKILMWGVSLVFGSVIGLGWIMHTGLTENAKALTEIDKAYSVYTVAHIEESKRGFVRIKALEDAKEHQDDMLNAHELRLHKIEAYIEDHRGN